MFARCFSPTFPDSSKLRRGFELPRGGGGALRFQEHACAIHSAPIGALAGNDVSDLRFEEENVVSQRHRNSSLFVLHSSLSWPQALRSMLFALSFLLSAFRFLEAEASAPNLGTNCAAPTLSRRYHTFCIFWINVAIDDCNLRGRKSS